MQLSMMSPAKPEKPAEVRDRRQDLRRDLTSVISDLGEALSGLKVSRVLLLNGQLDEEASGRLEEILIDASNAATASRWLAEQFGALVRRDQ